MAVWDLKLVVTDASNGSPIPGVPVKVLEGNTRGTVLGTTDASGTAKVAFGDVSGAAVLSIQPMPPAAAGSYFTTWDLALTLTSGGSPLGGVKVQGFGNDVITKPDGTAAVSFKVFVGAAQGLGVDVRASNILPDGKVTISTTATSTFVSVLDGGIDPGINVFTD